MGPGGIVYVADTSNHKIRTIFPNQSVVTIAGGGSAGTTAGNINGIGSGARFNFPYSLSVDPSGVIFVADPGPL